MELTEEQLNAVKMYRQHRFLVIDGGPGVGKTTTIRHLARERPNVVVVAPTGAAADRIAQATGLEAFTLEKIAHTMDLVLRFRGADIILDEASMVSMEDMVRLFHYLHPESLCLVGDKDQLPCIQGTAMMRTLVGLSASIPIARLTINHRQLGQATGLIRTIQSLKSGEDVVPSRDETLRIDVAISDSDAIKRCAAYFMENPDCQMLAYTNKAVDELNALTATSKNRRVVCTKNMYDDKRLLVANGCTGERSEDGQDIWYTNGFHDERPFRSDWTAARAMTVKKAQGNEFDAHGLIVMTSWYGAVPRELAVTALSRFKKSVTIFATDRVLFQNWTSVYTTAVSTELARALRKRVINE